ncbi:Sir2 silent information regulator family NAD-dependent deacetylase [Eubacteriaceae bacterium ES2]|nr:Sir2 silent information regulator family NAD-dependent deacetylase [Eubacteriaceae bacterium ES2]
MKTNNMDKTGSIAEWLKEADVVVIGAGAGLSASAGILYSGSRFEENFPEFIKRYGMTDMYSAGFYPFNSQAEKWGYWSKHIWLNRYEIGSLPTYQHLLELIKDKNYFVITTNVDHQFLLSGFDEKRFFATQGDYGLFQCAKACHHRLYDNEAAVRKMVQMQRECIIPAELVPTCPVCGGDMEVNIRKDGFFVEDEAWHEAAERYTKFLEDNHNKKILFLELGVGMNTPVIIKYPFWQMTMKWQNVRYISVNRDEAYVPKEIAERGIGIAADISGLLLRLEV